MNSGAVAAWNPCCQLVSGGWRVRLDTVAATSQRLVGATVMTQNQAFLSLAIL